MSTKPQKVIQPVFNEVSISEEKSGEDPETEDEETKTSLLSDFEKIVCAVKQWDPFPLRAHDVDDVNQVNKHVLLAIIALLLCTSFALIWISAFIIDARRSREYAPSDSFSSHILSFSAIILVISLVSFVFTLCGFVGVFRENIMLIRTFYIALIVLLLLKLSIALFTFSFTVAAEHIVGSALGDKLILNYRASTDIEATMDYLQIKFRCCGLREQGFKDWAHSIYFNCSDDNPSTERCGVPWSCCRNETGINNALCGRNVQKVDRNLASRAIYTKGCIIAILEWAKKHAFLVAFLLLLETLLLTVLIFQCIHLVNELQMMNGVYRGPWWIWIGEPRPDERPPFPKSAKHHQHRRPVATLPFHLELVWHEAPTPATDRWSPAISRQAAPLDDPEASARQDHRRSTAGQRFFRAVMSRASRVANRRKAMAAFEEEERRRSSARAAAPEGQAGWVVHHHAKDAGSVGPVGAVSHALGPVGEEREVEPAELNLAQKSLLPPIGVRSTRPEVQETTDADPVEQTSQSHDQDPSRVKKKSIGDTNAIVKKGKLSVSPGAASSEPVTKQIHDPSDLKTTKAPLPGLTPSQNQIGLPNIRSDKDSGKQLVEKVPEFNDKTISDRVPPVQKPSEHITSSAQPALNELTIKATPVKQPLAANKSDFKPPTSNKIALAPDSVEHDEKLATGTSSSPPVPAAHPAAPGDAARAPSGGAERAPAAMPARQPAAPAPVELTSAPVELTSAAASVSQRQPSATVTSADSRPTETAEASTAGAPPHRADSVAQPGQVDGGVTQAGPVEDATAQASSLLGEGSPAKQEDGPVAGSGPDQLQSQEVASSDASTGTPSGKKGRKGHRRRSKPRKKKKKGHVGPAEETASTGAPGAENEPLHEWLKPNPPKAPDDKETTEGKDSVYFSPSELKHLAAQQSPSQATASDPGRQRRGTVARAISRELHKIMPSFSPASAAQPQRQTPAEDDDHKSVARAVSRQLRDILPSFSLPSGGSSEPKPSASPVPARLPSPEPESMPQGEKSMPQGALRRPSSSHGSETSGQINPAASPLPAPEAESDSDHEW